MQRLDEFNLNKVRSKNKRDTAKTIVSMLQSFTGQKSTSKILEQAKSELNQILDAYYLTGEERPDMLLTIKEDRQFMLIFKNEAAEDLMDSLEQQPNSVSFINNLPEEVL